MFDAQPKCHEIVTLLKEELYHDEIDDVAQTYRILIAFVKRIHLNTRNKYILIQVDVCAWLLFYIPKCTVYKVQMVFVLILSAVSNVTEVLTSPTLWQNLKRTPTRIGLNPTVSSFYWIWCDLSRCEWKRIVIVTLKRNSFFLLLIHRF